MELVSLYFFKGDSNRQFLHLQYPSSFAMKSNLIYFRFKFGVGQY